MRAVFLVLLSANLLFLAWARWIDGPRDVGAQDSLSRLPRLQLVTESPPGSKPTSAIFDVATPLRATLALPERTSFQTADLAQTCTYEAQAELFLRFGQFCQHAEIFQRCGVTGNFCTACDFL